MASALLQRNSMTLDDFFTGFVAGLAARGVKVVSIRGERFHKAMEDVFHTLEQEADASGLRLKFVIHRNEVHGDSPDVREALAKGVQRDLVSLDNPEYQDMRLKITSQAAGAYFKRLPGSAELYIQLADSFIANYPAYS